MRVMGTNELIAPVCAAALGDDGLGPPDLRVHHPDLEDALISLVGEGAAPPGPRTHAADARPGGGGGS
jgi:hypothetical protein